MHKRMLLLALALILLAVPASYAGTKSALSLPVGGSFTDALGGAGKFAGEFNLTGFAAENGSLVAKGVLTGTLTDSTGKVLGSVVKSITAPAAVSTVSATSGRARIASATTMASCGILHLDIGPISLDLLGLNVDLSRIVLDITAETGGGNLLGNLLCSVTHLLDGAGALIDLVNLLNQIVDVLSGILG